METTPKGKSSAKGQTKGQVKGLLMQGQAKVHQSVSDTSVPTPSASAACGDVTSCWDQHNGKACCLPVDPTSWDGQPKQAGCSGEENKGGCSHYWHKWANPGWDWGEVPADAYTEISCWPAVPTPHYIGYLTNHIACNECEWADTANKGGWLPVSWCYQCCGKPFRLLKCNRICGTWRLLTR